MDHLPTEAEAEAAAKKGLLAAIENSRDKYYLMATCTVDKWTLWFCMHGKFHGKFDKILLSEYTSGSTCSLCIFSHKCESCVLQEGGACSVLFHAIVNSRETDDLNIPANIVHFQSLCLKLYERLEELYQEEKEKQEKKEKKEHEGYWLRRDGAAGLYSGLYYRLFDGAFRGIGSKNQLVTWSEPIFKTFYRHIDLDPGDCVRVKIEGFFGPHVTNLSKAMFITLIDEDSK